MPISDLKKLDAAARMFVIGSQNKHQKYCPFGTSAGSAAQLFVDIPQFVRPGLPSRYRPQKHPIL